MGATAPRAMNEAGLLVVVPARGGSKRLPGKNLRALEGRSLLERTADALRASNVQATCVLSTDDDAIATAGKILGWQVPFLRPTSLATDDAATVSVVVHVVDWFAETHGHDPALVMVLQVTSPFRGSACIAEALTRLDATPDADAVVAMTHIDRTPRQLFSTGDDGYVAPLSSKDVPSSVLTPNGALYLVRTHALRQTGSLFPPRTLPLMMNCIAAIDIDDADDWHLAEAVAACGLTGSVIE